MTTPRTGDEAFAQRFGVSVQTAAAMRRRDGVKPGEQPLDALLRAEAAVADLEAVKSIDEDDVGDFAESADPLGALKGEVERRSERHLRAQLAAHASWAQTEDPSARTRPARDGLMARFEREVDPDGTLSTAERARRAEHARKAFYLRLSLKSAKVRRERKEAGR